MNLLTKQDMSLNSNFYADQFNSLPNTFYKQDEMLQRLAETACSEWWSHYLLTHTVRQSQSQN